MQDQKRLLAKKSINNLKTEAHSPFYRLCSRFCKRGNQAMWMDFQMKIPLRVFRILFLNNRMTFPSNIIFSFTFPSTLLMSLMNLMAEIFISKHSKASQWNYFNLVKKRNCQHVLSYLQELTGPHSRNNKTAKSMLRFQLWCTKTTMIYCISKAIPELEQSL